MSAANGSCAPGESNHSTLAVQGEVKPSSIVTASTAAVHVL